MFFLYYFRAILLLQSYSTFSCGNHWENITFWKPTSKPIRGQMLPPHFLCVCTPYAKPWWGCWEAEGPSVWSLLWPSYPSVPPFWGKHAGHHLRIWVRNPRSPECMWLTPLRKNQAWAVLLLLLRCMLLVWTWSELEGARAWIPWEQQRMRQGKGCMKIWIGNNLCVPTRLGFNQRIYLNVWFVYGLLKTWI